jgi:predicted helicase
MPFQQICHTYQQSIQHTHAQSDATDELSLHPHLRTFLEKTAELLEYEITIISEPRRLEVGRPDFVVSSGLFPVGYIEAEAYGRPLDALTGHAKTQNERFIENLDNFILTNFVEFRLYTEGQLRATAQVTDDSTVALEGLLDRFLSASPVPIATPEALAKHLARRTRELQTQIGTTLTDENSGIYRMFSAFKELLLTTLTPDDFADMYAQTLAYGLFAARCTLPNGTNFSRLTAYAALPPSNPFLSELFYQVASPNLEDNVTYILDDIATLLANVPTEMLRTAFVPQTHFEDAVIHFYETFLAEYDPQRRVDRGVYYTPPQVISYIVRSVDALLKTELNKPDGLVDDKTLILDPATGTGGFLLAVLKHISEYITTTYGTGEWHQYINDAQLVQRLFGFEILVAPYTIAHLKLSLFLQAQGWHTDERLRVYLTNTLEEPVENSQRLAFAGFISDEANAAVSVKRDLPLLVILGNPPYPRHSANPSRDSDGEFTFIGGLIEDYKRINGQPIGERNSKALQADYVKFIRWAQWRIDKNGEGVIGYIVNNSFLDGPIFRGMRKSLMDSFNAIYLLNLHGSIRRTEAVPEGEKDENVFDIQQGVVILLCVKKRDNPARAEAYYADEWGPRADKYRKLSETDLQTTAWRELQPTPPHYLFVPQAAELRTEYEAGWEITDIFQTRSVAIVTGRDKLTLHRTPQIVRETVADFVSLSETEAREQYRLGRDSRDWKVHLAQADLRNHPDAEQHISPMHYRPFDTCWTYYTGNSAGFHMRPRHGVMRHLRKDNLALCVCRVVTSRVWQHALVTDKITENCYISNRASESGHVFPLYLYPNPDELELTTERLNFKPAFLKGLSEKLELPQTAKSGPPEGVSPEEILAYIYAILYSPAYRERYYEFLKYGFPRIPLPQNIEHFRKLGTLGQDLIDWHILKDRQIPHQHRFEGAGEGVVSKVRYADGGVWINPTQYFTDVPVEVWGYEVGAYQVCEKWLKDRQGSALSRAEVQQYRGILVAVAETLRFMAEIDAVIGAFPI